jgi:hypothetical protein
MKMQRYFIDRDLTDRIILLIRIVSDEQGLRGEYFDEGRWIEHPPLTDVLIDPSFGEEISEKEARKVGNSWGWNIDT